MKTKQKLNYKQENDLEIQIYFSILRVLEKMFEADVQEESDVPKTKEYVIRIKDKVSGKVE